MTIRRKSKFLISSFFIIALFAMVLSGKCSGMKRIDDGNSEQIFSNGTEDIGQPQEKKICKRGEDPSTQKDLAKLLLLSGYEAEISDVSQRAKALPTYQDRSSIKAEKTVGQSSAKEVCSESDKENPQSKVEHKKDLKDERFILMSDEDVEAVPDVREKADVVLTPKEAFEKSIVEKGKFALDYVLKLLENKYDEKSIYEALKGEIFIDPESLETRRYIVRDEYLSGNVKKKLRVAEDAAAKDEIFNINVQELRKVLPKDLTENEITVNLGATWFPPDIIRDFIIECFGIGPLYRNHISVSFSEEEAKWKIICLGLPETRELYEDFGTTDKNAIKLLEDLLNQNDAIVYTSDPSDKKKGKIPDNEKTIWNQYKQKRIKEKFQSWVWEDTTRKDVILKAYNEKFNTVVLRKYISDKLRFTGKNPEIALRPHQINAVAQIVYGGNTLLAHSVGAGKTYEMIAAAMELKSLGLSKKNLIIVPNHIIGQWESDFRKLYPNAKILVSKKNDFTDKKIIDFLTKIRDEKYDAIIITLENFFKIPTDLPIPSDFEKRSRKKPQCKLETEESDEMFKDSVDSTLLHEKKTGSAVRATKLDLLQLAREKQLLFENLGIDRLFVDEAHYFKNLHFYSKLLGGRKETPKKVLDFYKKIKYLNEKTKEKGLIFASGTAVSNTIDELFTLQMYLQPAILEECGLNSLDSWLRNFGRVVTSFEYAPAGQKIQPVKRIANFYNIPELLNIFFLVANVKNFNISEVSGLPKVERVIEEVPLSEEQKGFLEKLVKRAEKYGKGEFISTEDNMLKIINDARKLALEQQFFNPDLPKNSKSKYIVCAENVAKIYQETCVKKSTQIIFCDLAIPGNETFDIYEHLRDELKKLGVLQSEIAFIHNARSDKDKDQLFRQVREGEIRVLIGSTAKMGTGVNVQNRLIALHHLDCPWRPSDLDQREGRIIRRGNTNSSVKIYQYISEGTFDKYLYQMLERKQKFISQILNNALLSRDSEFSDDSVLSYEDFKLIAAGDNFKKEEFKFQQEKNKLEAVIEQIKKMIEEEKKIEQKEKLSTELQQAVEELKRKTEDFNQKKLFYERDKAEAEAKRIREIEEKLRKPGASMRQKDRRRGQEEFRRRAQLMQEAQSAGTDQDMSHFTNDYRPGYVPMDQPTSGYQAEYLPMDQPTSGYQAEYLPMDQPTSGYQAEYLPMDQPTSGYQAGYEPMDQLTSGYQAEYLPMDQLTCDYQAGYEPVLDGKDLEDFFKLGDI